MVASPLRRFGFVVGGRTRMRRFCAVALALVFSVCAWSQAPATVTYLSGIFPSGGFTVDGNGIIGTVLFGNTAYVAKATLSGSIWSVSQLTTFNGGIANSCNSDGSVFTGYLTQTTGATQDAFFWNVPLNIQLLNFEANGQTMATAVSGDGTVIGGQLSPTPNPPSLPEGMPQHPRAFLYYLYGAGLVELAVPAGYTYTTLGLGEDVNTPTGVISQDGTVAVGTSYNASMNSPALTYWTNGSPYWSNGVHTLPINGYDQGTGVSRDGSTLLGYYWANDGSYHPFTYNYNAGFTDHGPIGTPYGISDNGLVSYSIAQTQTSYVSYVWNPTVGAQDITSFLDYYGCHIFDGNPEVIIDNMSGDGSTFLFQYGAAYAVVKVPAYAINVQNHEYSVVTGQTYSSGAPGLLTGAAFPYPIHLDGVSNPSHDLSYGANGDGSWVYEPVPGYVGQDSFQYTARLDGPGNPPANNGTVIMGVLPNAQSISPTQVIANGPSFTLYVNGAYFTPGSVINFNGQPLSTTFNGSGQLSATVPAIDIVNPAGVPITVTQNGETSLPMTLNVAPDSLSVTVKQRLNIGPITDGTIVKVLNNDGTQLSTPTSKTTVAGLAQFSALPLPTSPNTSYEVVVCPPAGASGAKAVKNNVQLGASVSVCYTVVRPYIVQDLASTSPVAFATAGLDGYSSSTGVDGQAKPVYLPDGTYADTASMSPGIAGSGSAVLGASSSSNITAQTGYARLCMRLTRVNLTARKASGATYIPTAGAWSISPGGYSVNANGQAVSPAFWLPNGSYTASLSGSGLNGSATITVASPMSSPVFSVPVH